MKQIHIILFLLAVILVGSFWGFTEFSERDRANEVELQRAGEKQEKELKTLRQEILEERKLRKAIEAVNLTLRKTSQKSDSTANLMTKLFIREKRRKIQPLTDAGYDSLVSGLYPD
jgi:uncharacterized membrane protein